MENFNCNLNNHPRPTSDRKWKTLVAKCIGHLPYPTLQPKVETFGRKSNRSPPYATCDQK
jgi:hypothetical protein